MWVTLIHLFLFFLFHYTEALLFEFLAPRYAHLKNVVVFLNVGLHDAAFDGQSDEVY